MRTFQETVREGENMGRIVKKYPWVEHYGNNCCSNKEKRRMANEARDRMFKIEKLFLQGKKMEILYDGEYWRKLLDIGMYDGWPFWKPTPAVYLKHSLGGGEWRFYYEVNDYCLLPSKEKKI